MNASFTDIAFWSSLSLTLAGLVSGFLMLWKIPAVKQPVSQKAPSLNEPDLSVSVIIPAYNESDRLPHLLKSLAAQRYQPWEIVVVDDHSIDDTAVLAKSMGARVILADPIEPGWVGKSRACWSGARAASGSTLLFLDADTTMDHPDSLKDLLTGYTQAGTSGLFSVQPYHRTVRFYESFSALFNVIVMAGMNRFTFLGNRLPGAGAFGPCILCPRAEYLSTGGHSAIRTAVMDDLALGKLFEKRALPVHCRGGQDVISFRMYSQGFRQLFEGWTKSFGTASAKTHPLVMLLIIFWIAAGFSSVGALWGSLLSGSTFNFVLSVVLIFAMQAQTLILTRKAGDFNKLLIFLYPVLFIFFAILFGWSFYLTHIRHQVSWRGRSIDV